MKTLALLVFSTCISLFAMEITRKGTSYRTFQDMDTWDPCANEDYFTALRVDANPEFISDFNFKSPFAEYAPIIPGDGSFNRKEVCTQDPVTGTWRLADGWELFHRNLATADYDGNLNYPPAYDPVGGLAKTVAASSGVVIQTSHRLPYFSLYHKATGNLRTYVWRSSMVPIDGNMLGIAEENLLFQQYVD